MVHGCAVKTHMMVHVTLGSCLAAADGAAVALDGAARWSALAEFCAEAAASLEGRRRAASRGEQRVAEGDGEAAGREVSIGNPVHEVESAGACLDLERSAREVDAVGVLGLR